MIAIFGLLRPIIFTLLPDTIFFADRAFTHLAYQIINYEITRIINFNLIIMTNLLPRGFGVLGFWGFGG